MRHFEATGSKYPLVVKLGTITPSGADVFSYAPDENDMVTDPKLVRLCTNNTALHHVSLPGGVTIVQIAFNLFVLSKAEHVDEHMFADVGSTEAHFFDIFVMC